MTISVKAVLTCDMCDVCMEDIACGVVEVTFREAAARQGWKHVGERDFCEQCSRGPSAPVMLREARK